MKWGWIEYDISEILSYGIEDTKVSVPPWGYRARVGKGWAIGKTDEFKNMNNGWNWYLKHKCLEKIQTCVR